MIASNKETIYKRLSIEISEIMRREVVENLRLESMVEFPDIGIFLSISHHLTEIISDTLSLSSHDLREMPCRTDRIDIIRHECLHLILENTELLRGYIEHIPLLPSYNNRLTIAYTVIVESELDTIRKDEFRISKIPRELFGFLDLIEGDMDILRLSIHHRDHAIEKDKIRSSVFTSLWLIVDDESSDGFEKFLQCGSIGMLCRMT